MKNRLLRADSKNQDFIELVKLLDQDLAIRDGKEHGFYHQFNTIEALQFTVIAYHQSVPVACGAMKVFNANTLEIKRMYTSPNFRGKGYSSKVLKELENWALEMKYSQCILETGKKQPEAMSLYQKFGYLSMDNYEPYIGIKNSFCFKKQL